MDTPKSSLINVAALPWRSRVKGWLVALWNTGHRIGWWIRDRLDAIVHGRLEFCRVCGRTALMLYQPRVIPPLLVSLWSLNARQARALARKESLHCSRCGAKLRARRLAEVLLRLYPCGSPPRPARSVREWVQSPLARGLNIAEINIFNGLHEQIRTLPNLTWSDYQETPLQGLQPDAARSEDLCRLTYRDGCFDLVLTSETLEHVPDLSRALSEIRRVLRPGGYHVFTIPLRADVPKTHARIVVRPDGILEHPLPPLYHPGGDRGYLVFTEFGLDFTDVIRAAGFDVEVFFGPTTDDDVAQVIVARRTGP